MKKVTSIVVPIVLFLFTFCLSGVQANAATDAEQIISQIPEHQSNKNWQESFVLSSPLEPFESEYGINYWDFTYTSFSKEVYSQVSHEICKDSAKYGYDVVITVNDTSTLQAHIKIREEEIYDDINVISSNLTEGNNDVKGLNNWLFMQLTGLDVNHYDEIIEMLQGEKFFEILDVFESDDGKTFSVCLETTSYYVIEGDSLSEIAEKKLTTVEDLMKLNPQITDPNLIFVHDMLKIR